MLAERAVTSASPDELDDPSRSTVRTAQQVGTALIVVLPLVALVWALVTLWGSSLHPRDLVLGVALYAFTGHGVTIGFHRLFAHRSFRATRAVRVTLAIAGSMAFEGPVIGWVADHRRHHVYTDVDGDPHSPHRYGEGLLGRLRGLGHAHVGWLFRHDPTSRDRFASDLVADRDIAMIDRFFPLWCALSLGLPLAAGGLLGGTWGAAWSSFLWAGAVRICLLHHVTWSVNSVCHMFGRRPYRTKDRSTNVSALAVLSMGESFHNSHHAFPWSARHGLDRGQLDSSARLIVWLERLGWASRVRRPTAERRRAHEAVPHVGRGSPVDRGAENLRQIQDMRSEMPG